MGKPTQAMIRRQLAEAVATLGQHWPALTAEQVQVLRQVIKQVGPGQ